MDNPNFTAMCPAVAEAIEQMMAEQGDKFSLEKANLAELECRTGIFRARLRRMKEHDFLRTPRACCQGQKGPCDTSERLYRHPEWSAESWRDQFHCVSQQAP